MNIAPILSNEVVDFYKARDIARAVGVSKKTIIRKAHREGWPCRTCGNCAEYVPPADVAAMIIAAPVAEREAKAVRVRFEDLIHSDPQRELVLRREEAVLLLRANLGSGKEIALEVSSATMRATYPGFRCSSRALRMWDDAYTAHGLDGLVDQKRGIVGRKAFADDLDQETVLRYKAQAIEHGNARKGDGKPQLNIARAFRNMVADPTIRDWNTRQWLNGERGSKSQVPPSVRNALTSSMLATTLIQRGPKAAKLAGPFTETHYENLKAGTTFTADDMTANVYVWCNWTNEDGFLLIRPQILAAMDVGSMRWLCVRAIMRPKGQYNHDDVWGLIGDVFDSFGMFMTAILEGGTWQCKEVVGQAVSDEDRFGGLRKLGCQVVHTRTPRGKVIEPAFNTLQHAADNVRGFCGRHEQVDCPQSVKEQLALVRAGKAHPSKFFLSLSEYNEHLAGVMNALNHERNDGKICKGLCPADKWAQDHEGVERVAFPDKSKWMYRAKYAVTTVTCNGVRVLMGTGKNQISQTYSAPELVEARGRRVAVFYNDFDEADAVVYTISNGRPHQLICVAPRAEKLPRLGATSEQMREEATRKRLMMNQARTERASLAPYLQRDFKVTRDPVKPAEIHDQLEAVKKESAERVDSASNVRKFKRNLSQGQPNYGDYPLTTSKK